WLGRRLEGRRRPERRAGWGRLIERREGLPEVVRGLKAPLPIAFERPLEERVHVGAEIRRDRRRPRDRLRADLDEYGVDLATVEGELPGETAKKDYAECPKIRPMVDVRAALGLLGAHELRRPEDRANLRRVRAREEAERLRDAEVEDLD